MREERVETVQRDQAVEGGEKLSREARFAEHIASLDAGGRAALRRSLAFPPGTWPGAFPYVEPWVSGLGEWNRRVAYMVAGLQALSRADKAEGNLGDAARRLQAASGSGSVEARFLALLDADAEQLPHRLRQMITLMSSHGLAPDWVTLRSDLNWWRTAERLVQQRWARSYYQRLEGRDGGNDQSELNQVD